MLLFSFYEWLPESIKNTILYKILKHNLIKGEYTNIDNIIKYCRSIEEELLNNFLTEFENTIKKYSYYDNCNVDKQIDRIWLRFMEDYHADLLKISSDMDELIQQYNLCYLLKLHKSINAKMAIISEKIRIKRETIERYEYQQKIEDEYQKRLLKQQKQNQKQYG